MTGLTEVEYLARADEADDKAAEFRRAAAFATAAAEDYEREARHCREGRTMNRACDPVGAVEIAARLGVQRGTVDQWRQRELGFPEPRWTVGGRPAWNYDDVAAWFELRITTAAPYTGFDEPGPVGAVYD